MQSIDVDDPTTWPADVERAVSELADRVRDSTEYVVDLPIDLDEEDRLRERLNGRRLRAYHCTRLLDHEVELVRNDGLRPLSSSLVTLRIESAYEHGAFSIGERDQLLASHVFSRGDRTVHDREGQVCFVLGHAAIACGDPGLWPLLSTSGGEAIYFFADDQIDLLKKLGRPTIV